MNLLILYNLIHSDNNDDITYVVDKFHMPAFYKYIRMQINKWVNGIRCHHMLKSHHVGNCIVYFSLLTQDY